VLAEALGTLPMAEQPVHLEFLQRLAVVAQVI
jgi:hypothetical protein